MQIYLHVGIHRTGSTFLQKNIFPQLSLENSSFIYNPISIIKILNEEYIKPMTKFQDEIIKIKQKYLNEKNLKILISDENLIPDNFFYKNELELFLPLKDLNKIFDKPIILIFIRERASLIKSIYSQHFKMGRYKSFDEFLYGLEEPNIDINKINFSSISKTFSKDVPYHIWIFKFEKFHKNIKRIIKLLDLKCSIDTQSFSKFKNKSISNLTIKRTLRINKIFKFSVIEKKIKRISNEFIFEDVDKLKLGDFKKSNYNIIIFLILKVFNKIFIFLRDNANLVSFISFLTDNFYSVNNHTFYEKKKLINLEDKTYKNLEDFAELKSNQK